MSSLYIAQPGVSIDSTKFPPELAELLPFGFKWCFTSDKELVKELERSPLQEIDSLVAACQSKEAHLIRFCSDTGDKVPIPDEIVLMQFLYRNFLEARSELWMRQSTELNEP